MTEIEQARERRTEAERVLLDAVRRQERLSMCGDNAMASFRVLKSMRELREADAALEAAEKAQPPADEAAHHLRLPATFEGCEWEARGPSVFYLSPGAEALVATGVNGAGSRDWRWAQRIVELLSADAMKRRAEHAQAQPESVRAAAEVDPIDDACDKVACAIDDRISAGGDLVEVSATLMAMCAAVISAARKP